MDVACKGLAGTVERRHTASIGWDSSPMEGLYQRRAADDALRVHDDGVLDVSGTAELWRVWSMGVQSRQLVVA